ncbi:MAG TPA: hypothetical protein PLL53_12085 [Saprospiraceae bacterium]|nr:hypothetical protein [Saprospiraceae bacterium]
MKKLLFLSLLIAGAFAFYSCEKEVITPYVALTGTFTNTPDPSAGFWAVPIPDGSTFMSPKKYIVDGTSPLFGDVDETKSFLEMPSPVFEPKIGGFTGTCTITTVDKDGDKLIYVGEYYMFADFSNKTYLRIDGGTGKWKDAQGWFNTTGQVNPATGVNTLSGTGEVTQPKDDNNK